MEPEILRPGMAAAGAEEAGHRPLGAAFQRLAIDVPLAFEGVRPPLLHGERYCPIGARTGSLAGRIRGAAFRRRRGGQRTGLRSGSGMPGGSAAASAVAAPLAVLSFFFAVRALSWSGVSRGIGGPASLASMALSTASGRSSPTAGGTNPPAVST